MNQFALSLTWCKPRADTDTVPFTLTLWQQRRKGFCFTRFGIHEGELESRSRSAEAQRCDLSVTLTLIDMPPPLLLSLHPEVACAPSLVILCPGLSLLTCHRDSRLDCEGPTRLSGQEGRGEAAA